MASSMVEGGGSLFRMQALTKKETSLATDSGYADQVWAWAGPG